MNRAITSKAASFLAVLCISCGHSSSEKSEAKAKAQSSLPSRPELRIVPPELNTLPTVTVGQAAVDLVDDVAGATAGYVFHANATSPVSVRGWAYDDVHKTTPTIVWLQFTNKRSGQRYFIPADRTDRPDVADGFKVPWARASGFATPVIKDHNIAPGEYDVKIYQIQNGVAELTRYYPSPTVTVVMQ